MKGVARKNVVHQLQTADFNQAVAFHRVKACCLCIQNDFSNLIHLHTNPVYWRLWVAGEYSAGRCQNP